MNDVNQAKKYDLEERTLVFAKQIRNFIKNLKKSIGNMDDMKQLARSSGSVGANYREANDALSKKDFLMRIKICRKEAKETVYWLDLIEAENESEKEKDFLRNEAMQLMKIFGSIVQKSEDKQS